MSLNEGDAQSVRLCCESQTSTGKEKNMNPFSALNSRPHLEFWFPIYLKLDEARYYLDQMSVHRKHPRLLLFSLSAFLSSARSVTFHSEKYLKHIEDGLTVRTAAMEKYLVNDVGKFFVDSRNMLEKQGYPALSFTLYTTNLVDGKMVKVARISSNSDGFATFKLIRQFEEWITTPHITVTDATWYFGLNSKIGSRKELVSTCEEYWFQLMQFVDYMVNTIEPEKIAKAPKVVPTD